MKNFGDLLIELKGLAPEKFAELADGNAQGGWARDCSKDEETNRAGGGVWITFTLTGHKNLPSAFLFLTQKSPGKSEVGKLSRLHVWPRNMSLAANCLSGASGHPDADQQMVVRHCPRDSAPWLARVIC